MQLSLGGRRLGFTLIELMMVVLLLGLLAAIVVVMIGSHAIETKETALKGELYILRQQIMTYQLHHNGDPPPADRIAELLTSKTDELGQVDVSGKYGPYLSCFPANPINGRSDVKAVLAGAELTPDDTSGWLYFVADGRFAIAANSSAQDKSGRSLATY